MSDPKDNKTQSLFQKVVDSGHAYLDSQIFKSKSVIINSDLNEEFMYSKAVVEDPSYSLHSQGFKDKPFRVHNGFLKQMSYQDSIVAAVIQTRQNQVSVHSKLVKSKQEKGFMICLEDEDQVLAKIIEGLKKDKQSLKSKSSAPSSGEFLKSEDIVDMDKDVDEVSKDPSESDDENELESFELERQARQIMLEKYADATKKVEQYVLNCGLLDKRPFESKKWNLDSALRAIVRDTYTYDLFAIETVPDRAMNPHYWFPVDGGTIKYASADLKKYKDVAQSFINLDILYPEKGDNGEAKQKVIDLKPDLLEKGMYRWVQVIRGKIERAYTADELKVGIRNINTDIFNNGYGISELELLVSMVTGHLNAEFYNQAYFTQGFSAKGILHIKAAINRRKLDMVRTQWQHMLKGAKNSFQTPIFAGVEEVSWIPLTQSHNDIGFEGWMRYLTTMICAIFQIDPSEIGIQLKAEGSGSGLGSESNQKEKQKQSKDKGLYPLMKHLESFLNREIVKPFDPMFVVKFCGLDGEDQQSTIDRQEKESKFKKTVNEVRAEDGLRPLPGMDDVILSPVYMTHYNLYSKKAQQKQEKDQKNAMEQQQLGNPDMEQDNFDQEFPPEKDLYGDGALDAIANPEVFQKSIKPRRRKPLIVEVYKIEK